MAQSHKDAKTDASKQSPASGQSGRGRREASSERIVTWIGFAVLAFYSTFAQESIASLLQHWLAQFSQGNGRMSVHHDVHGDGP